MVSEIAQRDIKVCTDAYSEGDTEVFHIGATDILRLLADAHETEFTTSELADATDVTRPTVWRAASSSDSGSSP